MLAVRNAFDLCFPIALKTHEVTEMLQTENVRELLLYIECEILRFFSIISETNVNNLRFILLVTHLKQSHHEINIDSSFLWIYCCLFII